jgi:hypothetical protein
MTRKDYRLIALVIQLAEAGSDTIDRDGLIADFALAFASSNPRFDRAKWYKFFETVKEVTE